MWSLNWRLLLNVYSHHMRFQRKNSRKVTFKIDQIEVKDRGQCVWPFNIARFPSCAVVEAAKVLYSLLEWAFLSYIWHHYFVNKRTKKEVHICPSGIYAYSYSSITTLRRSTYSISARKIQEIGTAIFDENVDFESYYDLFLIPLRSVVELQTYRLSFLC